MGIWDLLDKRKIIEEQKVVCLNCEMEISMKISRDFTTSLCDCGMLIWYPPRKGRSYGVRKFISKEVYLANKAKHLDRESFIKDMNNRGITVKHPVNKSKIHRMLTHENEIERGNHKGVKKDA